MIRTNPISRYFGYERGLPIDRLYIEKFLEKNSIAICNKVLEISELTYSNKYGRKVTEYNILHFDNSNQLANIIGDLSKPDTLPKDYFDCFICTQTLNFIYDIKSAIKGCHQLLCKNGVFLGTVAGISQISRYDMERWGDYWRFTDLSVRKMFTEVFGEGNVEIITYGNALAATAFLQGLAVEEIPIKNKLLIPDNDYQIIIGIKAIKR